MNAQDLGWFCAPNRSLKLENGVAVSPPKYMRKGSRNDLQSQPSSKRNYTLGILVNSTIMAPQLVLSEFSILLLTRSSHE